MERLSRPVRVYYFARRLAGLPYLDVGYDVPRGRRTFWCQTHGRTVGAHYCARCRQELCPGCGRYAIWTPKDDARSGYCLPCDAWFAPGGCPVHGVAA